jgi:DNA-binding YbaB/EbfC family protein
MNIDPAEILKNLQKAQAQFGDVQEKLTHITAEGSAGGDLVRVEINGHFEVKSVKIDPIAVDPRDVPMLEELIQSAFEGAVVKIKEKIKEELSGAAGFPLPGGMMDGLQE